MVSVAGINPVPAPDTGQNLRQFLRILQRVIFIVKNIAGDHHKIRIFPVDLLHHLPDLADSHTVAHVQVCRQNDFQGIQVPRLLVHIQLIFRHLQMFRVSDAPYTQPRHTEHTDPSDGGVAFGRKQFLFHRKRKQLQNQTDYIRNSDN